jgi:lysine-specific demethylase 8
MTCPVLQADELHRFAGEFYARNRPVVIRGLRERHPRRVFDWSVRYFEDVLGDTEVPVLSTETAFLSYEREVVKLPYREFVARTVGPKADPVLRYYYKNPTALLPEGHDDSGSLPVLGDYIKRAILKNLWMSAGQITVGLHFDAAENFNFQLRGDKTFDLYPPGVWGYYPMPMFSQTAHISRVFREGPTPDLARFPRFDPSAVIRARLQEGDVIYIPAYWWHQVSSHGAENVNLNFWWLPSLRKQLANPNQALRGHAQIALRYLKFGNVQAAPPPKTRTEAS